MEFKGTKGDWNVFFNGFFHDIRVDGQSLASTQQNSFLFINEDIELANAKLIACAPEMLEFLISAFESFNKNGNFSDISSVEINELIKKATE